MSIKEALGKKKEAVEAILQRFLAEEKGFDRTGREAMNYSLMAPGKRIRPILVEEAFFLCCKEEEKEVLLPILHSFMAAIEMIHSFSLCHDDLPAMDNDRVRRGQDSTWAHFSEAQGILAGDALSLYAFQAVLETFQKEKRKNPLLSRYEGRVLSALLVLSRESGIDGMVGGQVVDLEKEGQPLSEEELFFIMEKKTAALLRASLLMGAILGGAEEKVQEKIAFYGENLGLAFQIRDDILDEISTTEELGKPVHSDKEEGKITAYSLYGREKAEEKVEEYTEKAISALENLHRERLAEICQADVDGDNAYLFLKELALYLASRKNKVMKFSFLGMI
ncbi:polyprenyl synthetase family protein [Oribacterium sp. oral taxon 108]|uniref:polyprenyl synthetase family protein n=1 Tax=Oribacterium sp. oral taxon 108 TaxID=712414 RepID=UPI00020DDECE|nr:polyprenyl synthetase family protein [Oribacterium sp. oral taxon 108]EGL38228.1 putative geranyltranstransferase [Oribacterium sp. oral taxon 108 str. F0425]